MVTERFFIVFIVKVKTHYFILDSIIYQKYLVLGLVKSLHFQRVQFNPSSIYNN